MFHLPQYLPPDKVLILRVICVIAAYALLIFAGRRGWLKVNEMLVVGAALIFWAIAWLLVVVVQMIRARYHVPSQYIGYSAAMIVPFVLALGVGLWYTARFIRRRDAGK